MSTLAVVGIVALLVALVTGTELMAAALPLLLVITLVPQEERQQLAELIAATNRGRRLRLWHALRLAVEARRLQHRESASLW